MDLVQTLFVPQLRLLRSRQVSDLAKQAMGVAVILLVPSVMLSRPQGENPGQFQT